MMPPSQRPYQQPSIPPERPRSVPPLVSWIVGIAVTLMVLFFVGAAFLTPFLPTGDNPASQPTGDNPAAINLTVTSIDATAQANLSSVPTDAPTTPVTPTTPTATPTPAPTFASFDDGTYQIGIDIQPGTYRTRTGSPNCYYQRLKGFSGTFDDIIANNSTDAPAIVTIAATDKGFESENCGTWTKDLSQITSRKTTFDDGMYIVGTDITPGTYKNTGQANCYYARLSNFSNSFSAILANGDTDSATIITIAATDKGFESKNCGTWSRI